MTSWQPIETAPKDGSRVWLYIPSVNGGSVVMGYYWEEITTNGQGKVIREYHKWMASDFIRLSYDDIEPTHWLPVPAPPCA